jgi:hypothetical protein
MAWTDIPLSHINFGLFEANPASATVSVAASDLLLFRYKELSKDTLIVDFNFAFQPSCAFDPRWACPLAPPENRLDLPIRAGERLPAS